ncbi:hypothetical protein [Listeria valentina]|uniref:hypothetical protein n=1 Tax=Listeria valentina TaxID=2705293 RepID=UPI001430D9B4|nr:hypothetical protein [Listeria valentina]
MTSSQTQRPAVKGLRGHISQPMLKSKYGARLSGKGIPLGYALGSSYLVWKNY